MHRLLACLLACLPLLPAYACAAQGTPGDTVSTLWRALSNEPGASADVAQLKRLFHPDAVVFGVHYQEGIASMRRTPIDQFLSGQEKVSAKGFYECEVSREMKIYDRFAVGTSVVESRREKNSIEPMLVGINSIQLHQEGAEWKILSLYYQVEASNLPIPIGDGKRGQCLR